MLTQSVQAGFTLSQRTVLVRLDIHKAFDKVWPDALRFRLHKLGLRGRMLAWITSFMQNRKYRVVRPATTEYTTFDLGVPQGSGLSPLLFNLFIAEISHLLHCDHVEFADDLTLYYSHWDDRTTIDLLNENLRTIEDWAQRWRVEFGDKNSYFVFHSGPDIDVEAMGGLQFFSRALTRERESVCLLGVHLDRQLTFRHNTDMLLTECRRRRNTLRGLLGTGLVHNPQALLIAYKGFVRSKIEVTCAVYCTLSAQQKGELEALQNSCLRLILFSRANTPGVILQNECSTSSLESRREDIVIRTYCKILAFPRDHPLRECLEAWWRNDRPNELATSGHRPRSFFGVAFHLHIKYFGEPPPRKPPPALKHLVPLPPWDALHIPANKIDLLKDFRCNLRQLRRTEQMRDLMSARAAFDYCGHHPASRRDLLDCMPLKRIELKIIARLRSGYAAIGHRTRHGGIIPCPGCGQYDTLQHMLLLCPAYDAARECYLRNVAPHTGLDPSISLLLGFDANMPAEELRCITSITAKFVLAIGRHI